MRIGLFADETNASPSHVVFASRTPFDERRVGAAAIYCSDGRFGDQMDEFLHEGLGLPRYDRIALPGGAACLAGHATACYERDALQRQLRFLIEAHELRRVVLIAHEGCAFYKDLWLGLRTVREQQAIDLQKAAELIESSHPHVDVDSYFALRAGDSRIAFEAWSTQRMPAALTRS